jgi:hypothetical protein
MDRPAVRSRVPLIIGITGASFSGKTWSALRLATGIERVVGGPIYFVDTESDRALHYADYFKFQHVPFAPPYGPLDYIAAFEHCASKGAKIIVCDQMTFEHNGEGGVMDQSEDFLEKKCGDDWKAREKMLMLSLVKPKTARKKLKRWIITHGHIVFILLYRAADKIKPAPKGATDREPIKLGWQPETTSDLPYEMTARFLLTPGSQGVPMLKPEEKGELLQVKNPKQFENVIKSGEALSEDLGERMARWAQGDAASAARGTGGAASGARAATPPRTQAPAAKQNQDSWIDFWGRRGVEEERILARFGVEDRASLTVADLEKMTDMSNLLKNKQATVDQMFPRPRGDEPPGPEAGG